MEKRCYKEIYICWIIRKLKNVMTFGGHFGFLQKEINSAPGKLWDFWQVIQDNHQNNSVNFKLYIIFSNFALTNA